MIVHIRKSCLLNDTKGKKMYLAIRYVRVVNCSTYFYIFEKVVKDLVKNLRRRRVGGLTVAIFQINSNPFILLF